MAYVNKAKRTSLVPSRAFGLLVFAAVAACTDPAASTEVIVVVDSDIPDLSRVEIAIDGFADEPLIDVPLDTTALPLLLPLVYEGGRLGPFNVTVLGYVDGGADPVVVEPRSGIFFIEDQRRALLIELRQACIGRCVAGEACVVDGDGDASCRDPEDALVYEPWTGPTNLPRVPTASGADRDAQVPADPPDARMPIDGGQSRDSAMPDTPTADGGMDMDAGLDVDGGPDVDASTPDASTPDASTPDASTPDAAMPDAGPGTDASVDGQMPNVCQPACAFTVGDPNGTVACVQGACVVACDSGFGDCDGEYANGCEADLTTHCGACAGYPVRSKTLTARGTEITASVQQIPLVIDLDDPDLRNGSVDGGDLCLAGPDGTSLPLEIEAFDAAAGTLLAWTRAPELLQGQDAAFVLYYGADFGVSRSRQTVWGPEFLAVLHMGDATDVSPSGADGAASGTTAVPGVIGDALRFNGATSYVDFDQPVFDNLWPAAHTLHAWIRANSWGQQGYGRVIDKASGTLPIGGWAFMMRNDGSCANTVAVGFDVARPGGTYPPVWCGPNNAITAGGWHHVVWSVSAGLQPSLYIDGQPRMVSPYFQTSGTDVRDDATVPLRLGNHSADLIRGFDGRLDEVRIVTGTRSDGFVEVEFRNQSDPRDFWLVGPETLP